MVRARKFAQESSVNGDRELLRAPRGACKNQGIAGAYCSIADGLDSWEDLLTGCDRSNRIESIPSGRLRTMRAYRGCSALAEAVKRSAVGLLLYRPIRPDRFYLVLYSRYGFVQAGMINPYLSRSFFS